MSRRAFLRDTGRVGLAAAGAGALLAGAGGRALGASRPAAPLGTRTFQQGATIEWWNTQSSPDFNPIWQKLLADFKAESGIDVMNSQVAWGDLVPRMTQAGQGGAAPAVSTAGSGMPQIFAQLGILEDVGDQLSAVEGNGAAFSDAAIRFVTYEDGIYGVPRFLVGNGIFYRKDLFKDAGIEAPDSRTDRYAFTWDEFAEACEKLGTADGTYPLAMIVSSIIAQPNVWSFLLTNEAFILDEDNQLMWDVPQTVEAYAYLADILKRFAPPGVATYDSPAAIQAFQTGQVAMLANGGEIVSALQSADVPWLDQLGFMPYPVSKVRSSYGGGVSWVIPRGDAAEDARTFVQFMMRPENLVQSLWPYRTIVTPTTDAARQDPTLLADPTVQLFAELIEQKGVVTNNSTPCAGHFHITPTSGLIETSEILSKTLQSILVDGADPAAAVKAATPDLQQIVDDNAA